MRSIRLSLCLISILALLSSGCQMIASQETSTTESSSTLSVVKVTSTAPSSGKEPQVSSKSTRKDIDTYVAYWKAKGLNDPHYKAAYLPNGKVKDFHYHAHKEGTEVDQDITVSGTGNESHSETTSSEFSFHAGN